MTTKINKDIFQLALIGIMALTRFDHYGSVFSLPDASLAVFFFAGLAFNPVWLLGVLLLEAGLIDYVAITQFSVSDFCISSAYLFLIPAYSALWLAGRYARRYFDMNFADSFKVFGMAVLSTTISFMVSNGSFYALSGRFGELSLHRYIGQFAHYYPPYLASSLIYIVIGLAIIKLWKTMQVAAVVEL